MDTLIQANIFFFITSVAVIAVSFFVILLVIKLKKLITSLHGLVEKVKDAGDYVSDETKDIVEDIKQSPIFRFLFPRRKKRSTSDPARASISKPRRKV